MKVAVFWSGGKDSCMACYLAKQQGHEVAFLMNLLQEDGRRTVGHFLDANLINIQSHLAGIPLLQRKVSGTTYSAEFKSMIAEARHSGVRGIVFGDIETRVHREWLETTCHVAGVEPLFPLWEIDRQKIIGDMVSAGFQAVIVATRGNIMGQEWLGRNINEEFVKDVLELQKTIPVDLCGEGGEYHTLATAGPLFSQRIKITLAQPVLRDQYWFADILGYEIE